MSFARKLVVMAVVPLLAIGQSEPSEDDDEAPAGDSSPGEAFAPYQTIIDRLPFGPPPPNFDPDAPPGTASAAAGGAEEGDDEAERSEEEQQIVASVRVSVLNKTPSGVMVVGFTDSSAQPQKHYLLKVGEKRDMWEVKEADPTNQVVVLVKNGVEATLKVGEGAPEGKGGKAGKAPVPLRGRLPQRMAGGEGQVGRGRQPSGLALLRDRRRKSLEDLKEEEARKEAAQAQARKDAAQAQAEREQQREALMQIQEELRRQREEREQHAAQAAQESQRQDDGGGEQAPQE